MKRNEIWVADLNPQIGTEPGKSRPVLVVQTDLLNNAPHSSTLVCPVTTRVNRQSEILRVHLPRGTAGLRQACDVMTDQLRAIDNRRLVKKIGSLPDLYMEQVGENLRILLDL
jgi:mRNA interferase MazF